MSEIQTLIEMGFPEAKVKKAIEVTGNNVEQAMEWLLAHADDPLPTDEPKVEAGAANTTETRSEPDGKEEEKDDSKTDEAKSLKCEDCGKLFRNEGEVQFHAAKTGHSNFAESTEEKKPLTEEEKQLKLKEMEEKLKQRRLEKDLQDKEETRLREKKRIQMSKEITETKRKYQEEEMKRIAEERRREKLEDKKARQKVLDQIAKDREDRKQRLNPDTSEAEVAKPAAVPNTSATPVVKKTYGTARLQIRLPGGSPLVQEFKATEILHAVRLWVSLNRSDGVSSEVPFNLATTFPRRVFTDEDMEKPLNILGLVPSSVLVVSNK